MGKDRLKLNTYFILTILMLLVLTAWWVYIFGLRLSGDPWYDIKSQVFAASYGIVALWGGAIGLVVSRRWGWLSSLFGRSLLSFSVGLLLQEFGQLSYSFYIYFLKTDIPYPSVGDIGYFGSIFFYIYGAYLLLKLLTIDLRYIGVFSKILLVIFPLVLLASSYNFILKGRDFSDGVTLKNALDIGYPLFQCVYVFLASSALVLRGHKIGGVLRKGVLLLLVALLSQYASDFMFLYKANTGTYYVGGLTDFMYLISYVLMALSIIELNSVFERVKNGGVNGVNGKAGVEAGGVK